MYWYKGNKNFPVFSDVELEISNESLIVHGVCMILLPFLGVRESRLCRNRSFVGTRQEQAETESTVH